MRLLVDFTSPACPPPCDGPCEFTLAVFDDGLEVTCTRCPAAFDVTAGQLIGPIDEQLQTQVARAHPGGPCDLDRDVLTELADRGPLNTGGLLGWVARRCRVDTDTARTLVWAAADRGELTLTRELTWAANP